MNQARHLRLLLAIVIVHAAVVGVGSAAPAGTSANKEEGAVAGAGEVRAGSWHVTKTVYDRTAGGVVEVRDSRWASRADASRRSKILNMFGIKSRVAYQRPKEKTMPVVAKRMNR